jgi:hypothetical protein
MKRHDLTYLLFVLFVLFVISDIISTYYALALGAYELNPFVASLIEKGPMIYPLMWVFFILILGCVVVMYERITKCPGWIILLVPILIEFAVSVNNVGVIWCLNG